MGDSVSKNGYGYTTHVSNKGHKAKEGDEIYFHLEVIAKDSLLYDSRKDGRSGGRLQRFKLLPETEALDKTNPLLDAFPLMGIGDSMTLYFPSDSLPQLPPGLEDVEFVAYNISVKNIVEGKYMNGSERLDEVRAIIVKDIEDYKNGSLNNLIELRDGYKVLIHEEGSGAIPKTGDYLKVHYYGALKEDGTQFDNSYARNAPFVFQVNKKEVIEGWDIAASSLKLGTKATLFIPSEFAYGDRDNGPIKANSDLVFYIEMLE